jgi:hypothetical protein
MLTGEMALPPGKVRLVELNRRYRPTATSTSVLTLEPNKSFMGGYYNKVVATLLQFALTVIPLTFELLVSHCSSPTIYTVRQRGR